VTRGPFAFTKWYIDCLDANGSLVILYWMSLEWRRLRLTWHSVTQSAPGAAPRTRSSIVACEPPVEAAGKIRWSSKRLHCEADLHTGVAAIATQELAPGVLWTCAAPAARTTIRLGDTVFRGTGYAEHIRLEVPPWQLGIRRLRWGRWIGEGAARSVVWIEWNGDSDRRWVFLDGLARDTGRVDERSVVAGNATLALDDGTVVIDRRVGGVISRVAPLRAIMPRWLMAARETRRTRTGTLSDGRTETRGTAVDEVVDFG
jgi:hypothetical protein